jgi:RNase P/RNase MRP subunit p30
MGEIAATTHSLGINTLGVDYHFDNILEKKVPTKNIIYRVATKPSVATEFLYLVVSEKFGQFSPTNTDIFVVKDFKMVKNNLKSRIKKGIGLEVTIDEVRKADSRQVGWWVSQVKDLYKFSKLMNCQFILSSGANSLLELVSGRSFDAILKTLDIVPEQYWQSLQEWIESRFQNKVFLDSKQIK